MYIISSPAPASAKVSITNLILGSLMPLVSFPSENVPAPPSPKRMLDSSLRMPLFLKDSTSLTRSDIPFPRSMTIGLYPFFASSRAANMPHGPNPTITGRPISFSLPGIGSNFSIGLCTLHLCFFAILGDTSTLVVKSTVYTMKIFDLSLASTDSRATCQVMISEAFIDSCLDIFAGKSVISRPTGSFTSLIRYEYLPGVSPSRHTLSTIFASILYPSLQPYSYLKLNTVCCCSTCTLSR